MHRHKPKHSGKNNLKVCGSRINAYLPRAESTSDSLCSFGVIQEQDIQQWQHHHLLEETEYCSEAKEYCYFPCNKHFPEVTTVPLPLNTEESKFFDVSSQPDNSGYEDLVLQGNLEDVKCEVNKSNLVAFCSNTGTTSAGYEKPTPRSNTTIETSRSLEGLQPRSQSFDDRKQIRNPKVDSGVRTSNDNRRSTKSLPFLQKPREERCSLKYENKRELQGRKQESKSFSEDICVINGKKVANSIPPEFQNLRHFLPLLTLCQCPDYDSAVIEIVKDYNDPCSGVASQTYSPY